jgi:hypothetical protein
MVATGKKEVHYPERDRKEEQMKAPKALIMVMAAIFMGGLIAGCQPASVKSEVMAPAGKTMTVGDKVRLFHSGNEDIQQFFCVGDIVPVSREVIVYGEANRTEVGKIKVLSYEGPQAILAEVVEGTVMAGNIAEKGESACMVYLPETN